MRLAYVVLACLVTTAAGAQDAALREAAESYELLVASGDADSLAARFDRDAFVDRIVEGLNVDVDVLTDLRRGLAQAAPIYAPIAEAVEVGGSYQLLRLVDYEGEPRARFRLIAPDGGLNYHDLLFLQGPGHEYRLVDMYGFLGGEDVTLTSRRALQGLLGAEFGQGPAADYGRHLSELMAAAQRGDAASVVDLYPRIAVRDGDRKPLLILYLLAAAETSASDYQKALALFERDFAGDPTADLVLIDHYFLRGDMEATLDAIDRLDAGVGGDPYLDLHRTTALLELGRLADASVTAGRLAERVPDLEAAHWPRLNVALEDGDHPAALDAMRVLEDRFGVEFLPDLMKREPVWSGFVASPQYKQWAASQVRR